MRPDEKMSRARAGLILSAPFFATLAMQLDVRESSDVETMETDGEELVYNPSWIDDLTGPELRGVVAHEVMHIASLHHVRRGNRDPEGWNEACDHAANLELERCGFTLPADRLADPRFDGMGAEAIYSAIQAAKPPPGDKPGQGQGEGQGPTPDPGKCGAVRDAAPSHDPAALKAAEQAAKVKVLQAAQAATTAGNCPEFAKAMVEAIRAPEVDWRAVLRRFVDESSRRDSTWSRPNRRHIHAGIYLPGSIPDGLGALGVLVDVSGSIDGDALERFMGEVQGAVDDVAPDLVRVVQWNREHVLTEDFGPGDMVEPAMQTGGGTDLRGCFAEMGQMSAVLVFTDLCFGTARIPDDPGVPVLWCKWGARGLSEMPFGELIQL